jgi:hypothetical protein
MGFNISFYTINTLKGDLNVASYRGSTSHVAAVYKSANRYRGSTRHVVSACQGTMPSLLLSVGKILPSPIQSFPIPSERFFSLADSPYSSRAHSPPGAISNAGGLVGDKRGRLCLQNLVSIITPLGYVDDKPC